MMYMCEAPNGEEFEHFDPNIAWVSYSGLEFGMLFTRNCFTHC